MDVMRFGYRYWRRNMPMAVFAQILSFIALLAELFIPIVQEMLVDYVIFDDVAKTDGVFSFMLNGRYGDIHTFRLFISLSVLFIILLSVRIVFVYVRNVINQRLGLRLETDLRMATFDKLMELDSSSISDINTGELLTTINSDTIMYKELFSRIISNCIDSIFVIILSSVILASINIYLLLVPVCIMPFFIVSLMRFKRLAMTNYQAIRDNNSTMNLTVQENIEAVRLVRSFTNERLEKDKFDTANTKLKDSYIGQIKLSAKFEVIFSSIRQFAYIGSIAVSAVLVMKGYMQVGFLVAATSYVLKIMNFITLINNCIFQMQQQLVSGKKMMEFMNLESKIKDGDIVADDTKKVDIKIENASMVIDGKQVLKNINLDIPYGKKVGIIGGTGSGKSVLLESFVRIHDMTSGRITLNGIDIRDYTIESLREQYSYVFQDVFLFSNTIDSNIAYSEPHAAKEQIIKAAKHAQAHSFIEELQDGYETIVGERGLGISGGQKQRVSIARALLKDAPVLIMDDSTSALDINTEKKLLNMIKEKYPKKTILISAHRISSVVNCDEIIYLQDGEIVERGTFDELMKINGHFAAVYNIQEAQKAKAINYDKVKSVEV
ncbi:ABC transporter ATP-binding protein/permease [Falcatimonas sp. MSJ-15]|uniref:ABC transporter ATP-binding protein n=1 Tax=Falcatimonas sp. MSJ-15 TaxID=2841515 RepID=UPI001C0F5D8B|nr:ABC transporter ATP-binding protein [Falcatimonas sp. MSJ-15]MBU5470181.1 ABC transporter ATP-binding protein/permease [Falcatimonas sp. MSJ-15]